jgi:hypothetical protein
MSYSACQIGPFVSYLFQAHARAPNLDLLLRERRPFSEKLVCLVKSTTLFAMAASVEAQASTTSLAQGSCAGLPNAQHLSNNAC